MLTVSQKLALLNSVDVVDDDCDGVNCNAVWVELRPPILEKMKRIGLSSAEIVEYAANYLDVIADIPYLDIRDLGFNLVGAAWYASGKGFTEDTP